MNCRFCKSLSLVAVLLFLTVSGFGKKAAAAPRSYADELSLAVAAMEQGKHPLTLSPIRSAITMDRNEPLGLVALGTLYLHSGSPAAAEQEFRRARTLAPGEPLAEWGASLAALAQGKATPDLFRNLNKRTAEQMTPAEILSDSTLLALYTRLMNGEAGEVRRETEAVTADETSALRLEIAGFAALRGGDKARGQALLTALLKRPAMRVLAEDAALGLTFEPDKPAQGEAQGLAGTIQFPPTTPLLRSTGTPHASRTVCTRCEPLFSIKTSAFSGKPPAL